MAASQIEEIQQITPETPRELQDVAIPCIDCSTDFIWTAGEQLFFRDKQLQNPPKRCKQCKRAKNRRLELIEQARETGIKQHIAVKAKCAHCATDTTVHFYPCQGRPVYCRACFLKLNTPNGNGKTQPPT